MPWSEVELTLLECEVGSLCSRSYPGHKWGCPNFCERETCPPAAKVWTPEFLATRKAWAVWNAFPFGEHVAKMRKKHPDWSDRKLACCLYWQGTARKQLRELVEQFKAVLHNGINCNQAVVEYIPEAHGVNVTETMRTLGIELEWPPKVVVYKVAIVLLEGGKL